MDDLPVNENRIQFLPIGSTWRYIAISIGVGVAMAIIVVYLTQYVLNFFYPKPAFILFVIPASITITSLGGGLVSSWTVVVPYAAYTQLGAPCSDTAVCVPSWTGILPETLLAAMIAGTVGYTISTITAWKHDDPPVWAPVAYYSAVVVLAIVGLVVFDTVTQSCVILPC